MIQIPIENADKIIPALKAGLISAQNKIMAKAKTAASKAVRDVYNIKAADLNSKTKLYKANRTHASSSIVITGSRFTLMRFNPRPNDSGVSVYIKKTSGRKNIRSAFIETGKGAKLQVFRRVRKKTGGLVGRLPIDVLTTLGPVKMFEKEGEKAIEETINSGFDDLINKEIDYRLSRFNK